MEQPKTNREEYAAFISYRHLPHDKEIAKEVQKAIESYRLPKGIVCANLQNEDVDKKPASQTLGKCFRDEDELAASHSLPENIKDALARSRMLIVICSPETDDSVWVNREIEEFIQKHGREKVIPVLASGASKDSIPPILVGNETIEIAGEEISTTISPLAADLRSSSSANKKAELLRIIAAVAGCNYDDLCRRQQKRNRTRLIAGIASVVVFASLIIGLIVMAITLSKEQLEAESRDLAAQSASYLEQGDRIAAIEAALKALPTSSADSSRPLVAEAQAALEAAIQINPDQDGNIWRPSFALHLPDDICTFTSSPSGGWAAVLDTARTVSVFNLENGSFLYSFSLDDYSLSQNENITEDVALEEEWLLEFAGADNLIIASRTGDGRLACFNAADGQLKWQHDMAPTSAQAISDDGTQILDFTVIENESILVGVIDAETGEAVDWCEFENPGILEWPIFLPSYYDTQNQMAYLASGGYLVQVDLANKDLELIHVNDYMTWSLDGIAGSVAVAASYPEKGEQYVRQYSSSLVMDGEVWWTNKGSYTVDRVGASNATSVIDGLPKIAGFAKVNNTPTVIVTAGNQIDLLNLTDGKSIYSHQYSSMIVAAIAKNWDEENDAIYLATAEGELDVWTPFLDILIGRIFQTTVPYEIGEASIDWYNGHVLLALLVPADNSAQVIAYRLDTRLPDETEEIALDDLISKAHEISKASKDPLSNSHVVHAPY